MEASMQIITPEFAKQLLEANTFNRQIRRPRVLFYVNQMKAGKWKLSPEGISISKTGKILNGQHRLTAIVEAGINIPMMVFTGVDDDLFDVIDTGMIRNASDVFYIAGVRYPALIPPLITLYNSIKQCKNIDGLQKYSKSSNSQLLDQYNENKDYYDHIARKALNYYSGFQKILQPSLIGALYSIFSEINLEDADNFFDMLCNGVNLKKGSTIQLLRSKLIEDKVSQRKMSSTIKAALIIKAWNIYRAGKEIKTLKFDHIREKFPVAA